MRTFNNTRFIAVLIAFPASALNANTVEHFVDHGGLLATTATGSNHYYPSDHESNSAPLGVSNAVALSTGNFHQHNDNVVFDAKNENVQTGTLIAKIGADWTDAQPSAPIQTVMRLNGKTRPTSPGLIVKFLEKVSIRCLMLNRSGEDAASARIVLHLLTREANTNRVRRNRIGDCDVETIPSGTVASCAIRMPIVSSRNRYICTSEATQTGGTVVRNRVDAFTTIRTSR